MSSTSPVFTSPIYNTSQPSTSREVVNQIPLPSSNQIPVAYYPVGRRDSRVP
jgi:hypothetical protein